MDIRQVADAELDEWVAFVANNPAATGFHSPGWRAVLSEAFAVEPIFLRARDNAGRLAGVLPLFRSRSLFFGDFISSLEDGHCGLDGEVSQALGRAAIDISMRAGCGCLVYKTNFDVAEGISNARRVQTIKTVVSTNRSVDALLGALNKKTRWGVRHASKQNLRVRETTEQLRAFYAIYAASLHRFGTPVFGPSVFEAMRRNLGNALSFYALEQGNRLVGGMLCLKAAQEWTNLYAAVEDEAQREYGGYLLYWTAIEAAARNGIARFNLGRSIAGSGAHRFKRKWTSADVLVSHYIFGRASERAARRLEAATTRIGFARKLWSRLPQPVVQSAGRYLRKSIPFI